MQPHKSTSPQRIPDESLSKASLKQAIQRARDRGKFGVDTWHQLRWYINFVRLDIPNLSTGDILNVQEEVIALCREIETAPYRPHLTQQELEKLQQNFSKSLANLVDRGQGDFGEFSYTVSIYRMKELIKKSGRSDEFPNTPEVIVQKRFTNCDTQESMISTLLMHHLIELLGEFGQSILRCLRCQKLFLQSRGHAKYCSRLCQSQSAAQATRQKRKATKSKLTRSPKKLQEPVTRRRK